MIAAFMADNEQSLAERLLAGDKRALARAITLVEDDKPEGWELVREVYPHTGGAAIVGVTGPPGVGKSTLMGALTKLERERGRTVAVLSIDPSSPFTKGALLGDRIRLSDHFLDPGVFIRSMANRGHLGGIAAATPQAIRVLDAAGFDPIIIETVGVGQDEVEIASTADSVVVLLAPGMGDAIQTAKAGILEIADLFAVNKSDKPDAHQVVKDLRNMIALAGRPEDGAKRWKPPIIPTVAVNGPRDEGICDLVAKLDAHWKWLTSTGELDARRRARARDEITVLAVAALHARLDLGRIDALAGQVADGTLDPFTAAETLLEGIRLPRG